MNRRERKEVTRAFVYLTVAIVLLIIPLLYIIFEDDSIHQHIIILIDQSDTFTKRHLDSVRNDINIVKKKIVGDSDIAKKVSLYAIKGNAPSVPSPIASVLIERKGSMSENRWKKEVLSSLNTLYSSIDEILLHSDESRQTPIFEYLMHISSEFKSDNIENRELILYSDFVQNIDHKWPKNKSKPDFEEYKKTKYYQYTKVDLKNVEVRMRYIERKKYRKVQTDEHHDFWESYFRDAGVKNIDLLSIY